jgi:hypothetical protein
MTKELQALREQMDAEAASLKQKSGSQLLMSETGPIGTKTARAILAVVEAQAREIEQLKARLSDLEGRPAVAG